MADSNEAFIDLENCVPSLKEALTQNQLDLSKLIRVTILVEDPKDNPTPVPQQKDRRLVYLTDGTKVCLWEPESLESLFRGDRQPPQLGDAPVEYEPQFEILELQVLEFSKLVNIPRDEEMKEIYSTLRRRPDGRSLGLLHDHTWKAAALMLGACLLSKAEFEAIMSRLERSCRTFRMNVTSRNYLSALQISLKKW